MKVSSNYRATFRACCYGYITQAVVVNLAPLLFIIFQDRFGVTYAMLSKLILINFLSQMLTDMLSIKFVDRLGRRFCMIWAHFMAAAGLLGMGVLPLLLPQKAVYAGLLTSTILYAVGGGLLEVLVSPITDSLPGEAKSSNMAMMHGFYSWGQVATVLLSTLVLKLIGQDRWFLLPMLWALLPICNAFNFMRVPIPEDTGAEDGGKSFKQLLSSKMFLLALLLMTCSGASELAMSQWASLFAERGLGVSKVMGDLLGPCMFGVFMGIGRTVYGIRGEKMNLRRTMMLESLLCIGCYVLATLAKSPLLSLLGCSLCGLSVSMMWPGMLSLSAERNPNGGSAMFSLMAMFGDIGCSIGPWLTGMVSSAYATRIGAADGHAGLKAGLLSAIIFPLIMFIGVLLMKDKSKDTDKKKQ